MKSYQNTVNPYKATYLEKIRSESMYPAFRGLIQIQTMLIYAAAIIVAALCVLGGFVSLFRAEIGAAILGPLVGIVVGLLLWVFGKIFNETSLMLVDLIDSTVEANCRSELQSLVNKRAGGNVSPGTLS